MAFGEKELGEAIKEKWGEFGAHYEVFKDIIKERDKLKQENETAQNNTNKH